MLIVKMEINPIAKPSKSDNKKLKDKKLSSNKPRFKRLITDPYVKFDLETQKIKNTHTYDS
jgi:hypothetical protein